MFLNFSISSIFSDEDMQSIVSLMSVNNNCDVAPLDDLEDIPDLENSADISDNLYDFTQQLEQMTTSLNGCIDVPTPLSGKDIFIVVHAFVYLCIVQKITTYDSRSLLKRSLICNNNLCISKFSSYPLF